MNKGFSIPNFLGGINESIDESIINVNEARAGQNFDISKGNLEVCGGSTLFTSASLSTSIGSLMTYYKNGVGTLLVASNGKLYKLVNSSFVELASGFTSDKFDFLNNKIVDDEVLIFSNGVDNVKVLNGDTLRDLKHDGRASADSPTNKAPKMDFMELHYERVWGAKDNTLYFSTANVDGFDPDDWTAPTDEIQANQHGGELELYTNDGSKIIGLRVIYDDIIIFKNKSIFKIFGSSPDNYTKIQIFSSNGAIADRSIVGSNVGAFFINKDSIYQFDGTNVKPISQRIKETFKTLNKDYIGNSVAVFYKNKYILAVPEGSSTLNNLVIEYDIEKNNFMFRRGMEVTNFIEFQDKLLYSDSFGKIYEYGNGSTFNGQAISSFYETGMSDKGMPDVLKDFEFIYFTGSGSGDLKISLTTERGTKEKIVTLGEQKVYKVPLKNKGRLFKYRFENVNGSKFVIKSPKIILDTEED